MGIIYKATSKTSGKSYIGLTSRSLKFRQRKHLEEVNRGKFNYHFYKAIKKYGWDDFVWTILDRTDDYEELKQLEIYYIGKFNTYENGYNMTLGGQGSKGHKGKTGSENHKTTTTEGQAKEVVRLLFEGKLKHKEIAERVKVSQSVVNAIANGTTWKHLYDVPASKARQRITTKGKHVKHLAKLTEEQVIEIKKDLQKGYLYKEIAAKYNVGTSTIGRIARGELWTHVKAVI